MDAEQLQFNHEVWTLWWIVYEDDFLVDPTSTKAANLLREAQHYGWTLDPAVRSRLEEWKLPCR